MIKYGLSLCAAIERQCSANIGIFVCQDRGGQQRGICTIESSESMPFSVRDSTGTPSTGSVVLAATMPGRCAAPPAPAIITSRLRSWAASA
jgi:hypothetical protein